MWEGIAGAVGIIGLLLKHYLDPARRIGKTLNRNREDALDAILKKDGEKALAILRDTLASTRDKRVQRP